MSKRSEFVERAKSLIGVQEGSKEHKQLVSDYNKACDKNRKADMSTPWCALTVGAIAEETGNVLDGSIGVPVDCSCGTMIDKAKAAGIWVEADDYVPNKDGGDVIMYDWKDNGKGDDTSGHDHTGIIISVGSKNFKVVEGNKSKAVNGKDGVGTRLVEINGQYIRGFIVPVFADEVSEVPAEPPTMPAKSISELANEVIAGKWGNNPERKQRLIEAGYDYEAVQAEVNKILNASKPTDEVYKVKTNSGLPLRLRKEPNTNCEVLARIPNGAKVNVSGISDGWAKTTYNGKSGYCAEKYLARG